METALPFDTNSYEFFFIGTRDNFSTVAEGSKANRGPQALRTVEREDVRILMNVKGGLGKNYWWKM